jgi:glycine hydroxymethyltransferase
MSQPTPSRLDDFARFFTADVSESDPELFAAMVGELDRQQNQIELIASENIVSKAVLQAISRPCSRRR